MNIPNIRDIRTIKPYMINLPQFPQKYQRSLRNLAQLNITPQRVDAVYGKDLDDDYIKSITYPSVHYTMNRGRSLDSDIANHGAIGCSLSHIKLWKQMIEKKEEMYLIIEDDVAVTAKVTTETINSFLQEVCQHDPNWDVILLGWMKPLPGLISKDGDVRVAPNIYRINDVTFGTHAYLINRKGAERLLKSAFPIIDQVDSYLSYMACRGDIHAYRPSRPFIDQYNPEGSSIQDSISNLNIKPVLNRFSHKCIRGWIFFFLFVTIVAVILLMRRRN